MIFLLNLLFIPLTIAISVYIAIKYDEYEKINYYRIKYKVTPLVKDPVDGEWEFIRKQRRFEYVYAEEVEKDQEESTFQLFEHDNERTHYERCA